RHTRFSRDWSSDVCSSDLLPSAGEFAEISREIARTDPDIPSVHISAGLSGTVNSARQAAEMVQEANITVFDTMTLSGAEGWQVEAAGRAAKAGGTREKRASRPAAGRWPGANIPVFDTMTPSGAEGWQVEAAARAAKAGWTREKIVALLETIRDVTETIFTLPELKYLIHGGRISHLKGLL